MARSIWRSDKICPDLKMGMVIKYAKLKEEWWRHDVGNGCPHKF